MPQACHLPNTLKPMISLDPPREFLSFSEKGSQFLFCRWSTTAVGAKKRQSLGQSLSLLIKNLMFPHLLLGPEPPDTVMTRRGCGMAPTRWVLTSYTPCLDPISPHTGCVPQQSSWSLWASVSPFVRHTSTFLKRLKRELNFTVCADIQNIFRQILRTQSIWLGERFISHSLYFYVQGLLLDQRSWLLFPLLLTLTRREGIYLSVQVEGYFGVHS